MGANDITILTDRELLERKTSLNKQDLILTIIQMRAQVQNDQSDVVNQISSVIESKIKEQLDPMVNRLHTLTSEVFELKRKYDNLQSSINANSMSGMEDNLNFILREGELRRLKENNLVFSGFEEEVDGNLNERKSKDDGKVKRVLRKLNVEEDSVISINRIGKQSIGKIRLVRVQCKNLEAKKRILGLARHLRSDDTFKNVFINPDYARCEQEAQKLLRERLKNLRAEGHDVIIHRGQIIKRQDKEDF